MLRPDADPYRSYRALRADDPVHWNTRRRLWVLTRYADVSQALAHPALSSQRARPELTGFAEHARRDAGFVFDTVAGWLLRTDPPAHTRTRRIGAPALRHCVAARARERVETTAGELLDRVAPRGAMEVIAELAAPLSLDAIAWLVGVPTPDHGRLYAWASAVGAAVESGPNPAQLVAARQSLLAVNDTLRSLLARRRARPADDLLTMLLSGPPGGAPLSEEDIIGFCTLLLLAGHETTMHLVGNGLVALLQNVDQIARLRTDPVLWPSAVQELLRYASPLHGVLRTASRDCVLGGKPIGRGERVLIGLAAGNRDPDKFIDPERLDVGRVPNPHLAFGRGIHHCPGASLAELIAEIAIRGVLERFAGLRLAEPAIRWEGNHLFRGLRELRVTF